MLRLTQERESRGWSRMEVARRANIHPADIGRLESGKIYPYPGWKKKLEEVFGVSGDDLFKEVESHGGTSNHRTAYQRV